ncbi:MAG: hypothetical protein CM1200mP29_16410 [Verrucomicrobiota bacterium]|nr:MAG: hypothetical protein CM1200mP29_16410 [Verrucomicrobiota bacterium]
MVRIALLVYIMKRFFLIAALAMLIDQALGQISKPIDAPKPLSPAESLKRVELPDGFRLELIVAEPLIRQPPVSAGTRTATSSSANSTATIERVNTTLRN